MKKILLSLFLSISLLFLLSSPIVSAAGLVQCDENSPASCSLCALFATVKAVYDFAIQLTIILAIAYIMFGGYQMLISGANPALYAKGRKHIYQAFLGLGIVLAAWFLVDIFIRALTGTGAIYGVPWRTLNCQ